MKYSSIPPGDNPMADAYNLIVSAWHAQHAPKLAGEAERVAKHVAASVNNWEEIAGNLALLASMFADFCDKAMPEEVSGVKYPRPSAKVMLAIESKNLVPA